MNEENEYFANYEGGPGDASVYINRVGYFSVCVGMGMSIPGARKDTQYFNKHPEKMAKTWTRINEKNEESRSKIFGRTEKETVDNAVSL